MANKVSSKARGPKAGSSQRNQSAKGVKAPKVVAPETIASAVAAKTGNGFVVTTSTGRSLVITRVDAKVNKLAKVGMPMHDLEEYLKSQPKPEARLAKGVDSHNSPQSAKAVADQHKNAKPAATKAPKAEKNKAPARGADRDYTRGKTEIKANPESWRHHMITIICKNTNTAKAKAAHAKSGKFSNNKLDFNWAAANGYINWAK